MDLVWGGGSRSLYILHICILATIVDGFDKWFCCSKFVVQFGKMKTKILYDYVVFV